MCIRDRLYTAERGRYSDRHPPLKQRDYFPDNEEQTVESRILQDSIGYLTIKTMMHPVMEDFKAVYPKVKDLPYLIIDCLLYTSRCV